MISDAIEYSYQNADQGRIAYEGIKWLALMLRKNKDYGSAVWKPALLSPNTSAEELILIRMSDKISRLANLLRDNERVIQDETLEDTMRDLGAYCLLFLTRPKE